jgi:histone-lysine N-methyltransferase SETMAR
METSEFSKTENARKSKPKIKVMLIVFFDCHGIVHHEFVPEGQTVNAAFYMEVLKHLTDRMHRVRPNLRRRQRLDPSPGQCPSNTALIVREVLVRNSITVMDHPPYSPDLAPCDFFLFPKCKLVLHGQHLGDVATITVESMMLKGLQLSRTLQPMETEVGKVHCV